MAKHGEGIDNLTELPEPIALAAGHRVVDKRAAHGFILRLQSQEVYEVFGPRACYPAFSVNSAHRA
jgi:hypothetical protein